jgi:two-component system sensor histidine kinase GlrK
VIEDFQDVLQAKSIRLNKLIRPIKIEGFPKQLRDMLEQLLSNAIKFSPSVGEVRIKLCKSRDRMKLEIEDDGPGIDPEELSHIFEPFYRGTPSSLTEAANQGPGLGLALVQEYVSNHQGKIKFIDPKQGQQGTCVRVQIPLNIED